MTIRANMQTICSRFISAVASIAILASCPLVSAQAPIPPELAHGSKVDRNQTYNLGAILKEIASYGSAAKDAVPLLKEAIVSLNDQVQRREFPSGELNDRRVRAVEDAIKTIEAAKDQPKLRSIGPAKQAR